MNEENVNGLRRKIGGRQQVATPPATLREKLLQKAMLQWNPRLHKGGNHPENLLRILQAFRRGELPRNEDDGTWAGALRSIQYSEAIKAGVHLHFIAEDRLRKPERAANGDPLCTAEQALARRAMRRLLENHIPMYLTDLGDFGFRLHHCFLETAQINERAWNIVGNYVKGIASDLRFEIRWGGDMPSKMFDQWEILDTSASDPWIVRSAAPWYY